MVVSDIRSISGLEIGNKIRGFVRRSQPVRDRNPPGTCSLASGRSGARVPDRLCVGTSRHLHQWLGRREIRTRASVRSDRGAKVGPAAAAEIATVPDISPELLGRVTLTTGLAERDRMIPASREEQGPLPNEQQHGMHPRPQAGACQEPRRKIFVESCELVDSRLMLTSCPLILVDSSSHCGVGLPGWACAALSKVRGGVYRSPISTCRPPGRQQSSLAPEF
jgi:hypothetical protein